VTSTGPLRGRASVIRTGPPMTLQSCRPLRTLMQSTLPRGSKPCRLCPWASLTRLHPLWAFWAAYNQIKGPKEPVPMIDSPHNNTATAQQQAPFNEPVQPMAPETGQGRAGDA